MDHSIEKASVKKKQQQVYRVRPAPTSPPFYRPQRGLKVIRITADCLDCACHNLSVAQRRHYLISKRGATRTRLGLRLRAAEQRTGRLPVGVFPLTSGACLLSPRRCFLHDSSRLSLRGRSVSRHEGALDGGSPMSHVDFKKWQCPL